MASLSVCGRTDNHFFKVSRVDIASVLNHAKGLGRASQTRLHIYNLMHKFFGDAVDLFQVVSVNPVLKKLKPKLVTKTTPHLEVDEVIKLLTHVKSKNFEFAIWLHVYLGLRVGEVQFLKWKHIDMNNRCVSIEGTFDRKTRKFKNHPKGGKWLKKYIPEELFKMLSAAQKGSDDDFVVKSPRSNYLSYDGYYRALQRYCKELGITQIGTHGLRHSTSELYMKFGASRDDLRILFGHSNSKVTDIYVHDKGQRLATVADNISLFGCTGS